MRYFSLLAFCILLSCSDDDKQPLLDELSGTWVFTRFNPGFAAPQYYELDEIHWTFNAHGKVLVSTDQDLHGSHLPILDEGVHEYQVNGDKIVLDSGEYDFSVEGNELIIDDHPASDGFYATFQRVASW
jgi:hypothetical protein